MRDDREAVMRAARAYDEIEKRMGDLQRQLDEAVAHQKAGEKLVDELRLELAESRTAISTYRADAEQARADTIGIMSCLADIKAIIESFQIPSERLPMRRKRNSNAIPEYDDVKNDPAWQWPDGHMLDAPKPAGGMADSPVNAPRAGGDPALATGTDGQSDGQL